jgi:hypothetical protein
MSSSRQSETDGLTKRVNCTFQQLLQVFSCYDGSYWGTWLPRVKFAHNASYALGIEHTPVEAKYGFSLEEPPDLMLPMRPPIPIYTVAQ